MSALTLAHADIALWEDAEDSRVVLPILRDLTPTVRYEMALTRFAGDRERTGARGVGRDGSFRLTARFLRAQHDTAAALLDLFDYAALEASSGVLLLRTHLGEVAGLAVVAGVVVSEVTSTPVTAGVWDISFTAETVAWDDEA